MVNVRHIHWIPILLYCIPTEQIVDIIPATVSKLSIADCVRLFVINSNQPMFVQSNKRKTILDYTRPSPNEYLV